MRVRGRVTGRGRGRVRVGFELARVTMVSPIAKVAW